MKPLSVNTYLLRRDLLRQFPVWGLALLILCVFVAPNAVRDSYTYGDEAIMSSFRNTIEIFSLFAGIADFLSVLIVFGFLTNKRGTDFFMSAPLSRGSLFLTKYLSALIAGLVPSLLGWSMGFVSAASLGWLKFADVGSAIVSGYLIIIVAHVAFTGMAALIISALGNGVLYIAVGICMQFVFQSVIYYGNEIISRYTWGYTGYVSADYLQWIPSQFLIFTQFSGYDRATVSPLWLCFHFALGIGAAALGMFFFNIRKSEHSGDAVAIKQLAPVFKYAVMTLTAILFSVISYGVFGSREGYGPDFALILGAIVGVFGAEMLLQKTFFVFKRVWRSSLIGAAVLVAVFLSVMLDATDFENRVPDPANVVSVSFSDAEYTDAARINEVIELHKFLVANKKTADREGIVRVKPYDLASSTLSVVPDPDYDYTHTPYNLHIKYTLKNGKTMRRDFLINGLWENASSGVYTEAAARIYALHHTPEYAFLSYPLLNWSGENLQTVTADLALFEYDEAASRDGYRPYEINQIGHLDNKGAVKLREAVIKDIYAGTLGVDSAAPPAPYLSVTETNVRIQFKTPYYYVDRTTGERTYHGDNVETEIPLDLRAANTLAVLAEYGIPLPV